MIAVQHLVLCQVSLQYGLPGVKFFVVCLGNAAACEVFGIAADFDLSAVHLLLISECRFTSLYNLHKLIYI